MRRTTKLFVTLFLISAAYGQVLAQPGQISGFSFLRIEPGARASALAGSFGAMVGDDPSSFYYNPASINEQMDGRLSVSYLNHLSDINMGFISYATKLPKLGLVVGGIRYLNYGNFERADINGLREGTFGASDVSLSLGLAREYGEKVRYGASLSTVFSGIDDASASALTMDAGVLYLIPSQQISIGASLHHFGTVFSSLGATDDQLPFDLRFVVGKSLNHLPVYVSITGYNLHQIGDSESGVSGGVLDHLIVGTEFRFSNVVKARFGYNHQRHESLKTGSRLDLAGFSTGFGISLSRFQFDYAFNAWSSLGGLHQISLGTQL